MKSFFQAYLNRNQSGLATHNEKEEIVNPFAPLRDKIRSGQKRPLDG